jgi:hypothetical protein
LFLNPFSGFFLVVGMILLLAFSIRSILQKHV